MMNGLRNKTAKGFTLIELMIVIAIIGILAAIAVPNFNRARLQAKKKACTSNMKTIEGAAELYNMENATGADKELKEVDPLVKGGYLKATPNCPSGGKYSITSGGDAGAKKTEIVCDIHGSLSLQDTTDKDKGVK